MSKSKLNPNSKKPESRRSKRLLRTKTERIIKLLKRPSGATIEALQHATGWQAHSVRGFLSGTIKRKRQLSLISECGASGIRRYRITDLDGNGASV